MLKESFELSDHFGTFHKTGDTYDIRFERLLIHPASKVWDAITKPEQLAKWFGSAEIDLKIGGKIKVQMMMATVEGEITQLKTGCLLEYTFGGNNTLRWELIEETKDRCRLIFTEHQAPLSDLQYTAPGWHGYLDLLNLALDGTIEKRPTFSAEEWQDISGAKTAKYIHIIERLN
ncbi:MAG TPA: SRPBCC family protein [Mucilaginibacter sp.]|nr:SRPBCC family protein [Mucilaginibacter sp.]